MIASSSLDALFWVGEKKKKAQSVSSSKECKEKNISGKGEKLFYLGEQKS